MITLLHVAALWMMMHQPCLHPDKECAAYYDRVAAEAAKLPKPG